MNTIYDAKILIVDDNADLLALLCEQLRGAGYGKIRTAQSCGGARAAFAAGQPELMILDINLPETGTGFLYSVRCGPKRMCRRYFYQHGMRMQTGCSGWGWGRTIT